MHALAGLGGEAGGHDPVGHSGLGAAAGDAAGGAPRRTVGGAGVPGAGGGKARGQGAFRTEEGLVPALIALL